MKTIKTTETTIKFLKQGYYLAREENELNHEELEMYLMDPNGEKVAMVKSCAYIGLLGIQKRHTFYKLVAFGNQKAKLTLNDLDGYFKKEEKKAQKNKAIERNKKIKEAIKYFNGWSEGDNITITADFVEYAELLKGLL